ncbi:hypothetical protein Tco_0382785 [Tanacetum coccineum]
MTSFDYRLNPIYAIKECSTCGVLYTADFCCSNKGLEDKILVPKPPRNCARCARCGTPVDGPYCQGCALLRKKFKEDLFTYYVENEFFEDLQDTSESSDDNTNVVNAPQEPFVGNQDPGENSSPSPLHIDHCCHECGDSLDGIFCQQCTCKSCGKGAHYGYNCPLKVPIISNPEPCNTQTISEPLQNLQSVQQQCLLAIQKKEEQKQIAEEQAAKDRYWKIPICYDDDDDYTIAITPDEVIKSSVENLIPIPSEPEGIPDNMCDVPLCNNPTSLEAFKEHSETIIDYNDDSTSSDDDSPYGENIDYVDASSPDVEIVSLEVVEIVDPEVGRIDDDILLTIKDDIPSVEKISSSTSPNLFLEEINTFDNSSPEAETFCFDLEEIKSIRRYEKQERFSMSRSVATTACSDSHRSLCLPPISQPKSLRIYSPLCLHQCDNDHKDFPDCEDSRACSIHMSFTSSASFWESSIQI